MPYSILRTRTILADLRPLVVALGVTLSGQIGVAQQSAGACSSPESRALDFWVGEWRVRAFTRAPGAEEWTPHNTWFATRVITRVGGCVIYEESIDSLPEGVEVVGISNSAYNPSLGRWEQTWHDRDGNVFEYRGGPLDEGFVLDLDADASHFATVPRPQVARLRMRFNPVTADSLVWSYEYTVDGVEWIATTLAHYTRSPE